MRWTSRKVVGLSVLVLFLAWGVVLAARWEAWGEPLVQKVAGRGSLVEQAASRFAPGLHQRFWPQPDWQMLLCPSDPTHYSPALPPPKEI